MRKATVEITMLNGGIWFMPEEELVSMGVPETPMAIINQYLRGSKGPTMRVNSVAEMTGDDVYINVSQISEVSVTYD